MADSQFILNLLDELKFRLDLYKQTKREFDRYIASDFNVFNFIKPNEIMLSAIFADLLDPEGSHGQGNKFLEHFLKNINIDEILITDKIISVEREYTTKHIESYRRRIDIILHFQAAGYGLAIENKPWAREQEDQVADYVQNMRNRFNNNYSVIYLSGTGDPPVPYDSNKDFKVITWAYRNEFKQWLSDCHKVCLSEKIRWFLRDFIKYIESEFRITNNPKEVSNGT